MEFNKNRHSVYKLLYHLVVVTKYRHPVINAQIRNRLIEIAQDHFKRHHSSIIEMETETDHVHILFQSAPQTELIKLVNSFKTVTSRYIRKEFSQELTRYYWKPVFWSASYCLLTTGGATIDIIKQYISKQDKPT
jgi:putative transposase